MSRVESELRGLASFVEWPDTPDVATVVAARIAAPPARRRAPRRLGLVLALVLLALAVALAVPPARSAILDWLGIGGARIVRVDELPPLPLHQDLELLGRPATLAEARAQAGFRFADPPRDEPRPDEVRLAPGLRVSYLWRDGAGARLIVTEFPGRVGDPALLKKLAGDATRIDRFAIDGDTAVWLEGGPHVVLFVAPDGLIRDDHGWLAGNTLLVDRGGTTVRVEGALDRADAVDLVRAMPASPSSEG